MRFLFFMVPCFALNMTQPTLLNAPAPVPFIDWEEEIDIIFL